jgi:hypothetical protein
MPNHTPHATQHEHEQHVQSFLLQSEHYLCGTEMKSGINNQKNNEEKHGDNRSQL